MSRRERKEIDIRHNTNKTVHDSVHGIDGIIKFSESSLRTNFHMPKLNSIFKKVRVGVLNPNWISIKFPLQEGLSEVVDK